VSVAIKTDSEEASEKIVNGVMDAYLTYIEEADRAVSSNMLTVLNNERRRQQQATQALKENIRTKMRAKAAQDAEKTIPQAMETLSQEVSLAEKQLLQNVATAESTDVSLDQNQLERTNRILDQIDDRIAKIQSERRAPGQIVPLTMAVSSPPNPTMQFIIAGMGAVVVFFSTVLLGIVVDCFRFFFRLFRVRY
jgi:uncharacterized protein (DUF1501 family)